MPAVRNTPEEMRVLGEIVRKVHGATRGEILGFAISVVLPGGNVASAIAAEDAEALQALVKWAPTSMKAAIDRMMAGIIKPTIIEGGK
jgi:hypothetical protein